MFTGIITARGEIVDIQSDGDWVFTIATPWDCQVIDIGAVSYTHLTLPTICSV